MAGVAVRTFLSPTLCLLAFDWPDGERRRDFLGFAIRREPGFGSAASSWLPNRICFDGPSRDGRDFPSDRCPIQKFQWWDARIDDKDRGREFTYTVTPVVGKPGHPQLLDEAAAQVKARIPRPVEDGVGTYFNRAVVSSQAFSREFGTKPTGKKLERALVWLANGLEQVIPQFLVDSPTVEGAIYHLTDRRWVFPAFSKRRRDATSLVVNHTTKDDTNADAEKELDEEVEFQERTKAHIMHDKFLVRIDGGGPDAVLMGSANFTTEGLTSQANLLHTFDSPGLAKLYLARKRLLDDNPTIGQTAKSAGWSDPIRVRDARIRVFFPPEPKGVRESIEAVVDEVKRAKSSVLFCLFSPTDAELRSALFEAGDQGKMMFGLINKISRTGPGDEPLDAQQEARVEIYHRSRRKKDVYGHSFFPKGGEPGGFWWEIADLGGELSKFPVYIHHKFVVIDGETDAPTVYTGSANMSKNAVSFNDENLLEIKGDTRLARIYVAEFLRLYEHYRARAAFDASRHGQRTFELAKTSSWARKYYRRGSPEFKSRISMASGRPTTAVG